MTDTASGFQLAESGPGAYERYMVPIHCLTRVEDLLDRVNLQPGEHMLDVACGSGIVSRHAARRVGHLGRILGVELNPAMLEIAREISAYVEPVEFVQGDAQQLPVGDAEFEVVVCQAAIMFIPDREVAVREMHRALKVGGRVGLNVFRGAEFNPGFKHLITALERHAGADAAAFMRSPFVMESTEQLRGLFEQARFNDIRVVHRIESLRYPSVAHQVRYETLNIPDPEIQSDDMQQALTREMEQLCAGFVDDQGVVYPAQDYVVTARK